MVSLCERVSASLSVAPELAIFHISFCKIKEVWDAMQLPKLTPTENQTVSSPIAKTEDTHTHAYSLPVVSVVCCTVGRWCLNIQEPVRESWAASSMTPYSIHSTL